jgi:hypothetical protein
MHRRVRRIFRASSIRLLLSASFSYRLRASWASRRTLFSPAPQTSQFSPRNSGAAMGTNLLGAGFLERIEDPESFWNGDRLMFWSSSATHQPLEFHNRHLPVRHHEADRRVGRRSVRQGCRLVSGDMRQQIGSQKMTLPRRDRGATGQSGLPDRSRPPMRSRR